MQKKKEETEIPRRQYDEEEVRLVLGLSPPRLSFEEMMMSESNRNNITMQEYSNGLCFHKYKSNKLYETNKILQYKLDDKVKRFRLVEKIASQAIADQVQMEKER